MSEDENAWSRRLISDLQTMPLYSYAKNVNSVTFKLVKPKKRATFYLPAALAARLIVVSFFMASVYQVGVSVEWFILAVLMAFIFSIAVPAIPGGALLFYPMLFSQLGIPAGAMALVLATDFFFDCICTALCMVSTELALVQQADKMEMLDEKKLKAE